MSITKFDECSSLLTCRSISSLVSVDRTPTQQPYQQKDREFRSHILSTIRGDIDNYLVHFQLELSSEIWSFGTKEFRSRVSSTPQNQARTHAFPPPSDLRAPPTFPGRARSLERWGARVGWREEERRGFRLDLGVWSYP